MKVKFAVAVLHINSAELGLLREHDHFSAGHSFKTTGESVRAAVGWLRTGCAAVAWP